ncbi:MAG: hypothetical protein AAFY54_19965 [Cyanobacteria bacterium J06648_10]
MRLKYLFIAPSLTWLSVACFPFSNAAIRFQDVQHGQALSGTEFSLSLEKEIETLPTGQSLRPDTLSLVHQQTGKIFPIATGPFWVGRSEVLSCRDCIKVIKIDRKSYLLTQFYGSGSGSFFLHNIVELTKESTIVHGTYKSCGQVFLEDNQLLFHSYEFKCPVLFLSIESGLSRTETFSLSD